MNILFLAVVSLKPVYPHVRVHLPGRQRKLTLLQIFINDEEIWDTYKIKTELNGHVKFHSNLGM